MGEGVKCWFCNRGSEAGQLFLEPEFDSAVHLDCVIDKRKNGNKGEKFEAGLMFDHFVYTGNIVYIIADDLEDRKAKVVDRAELKKKINEFHDTMVKAAEDNPNCKLTFIPSLEGKKDK